MNIKKIRELYEKLIVCDDGMRSVRFDLHIHSPESDCFKRKEKQTKEQALLQILDTATQSKIEIIAITDHNSFDGFNMLQDVLKKDSSLKIKYDDILILCGIEITCFSKHVLAIFDEKFGKEQQNRFLEEIGILKEDRGQSSAVADLLGAPVLMQKIAEYGGITILAHADTEKGFLYSFCKEKSDKHEEFGFKGKSLANIITSPNLFGIQVSQQSNMKKIENLLGNVDYCRQDRQLPLLTFSDYHGNLVDDISALAGGHCIGEKYSLVNLSHISFASLKLALADPQMRIANAIDATHAYIIGCAINSTVLKQTNEEYCFIRFSPRMNCLIGARGTGKSTILEIIQHIISRDNNTQIEDRFSSAVLFMSINKKTYAISFETRCNIDEYTGDMMQSPKVSLYEKTTGNSFRTAKHGKAMELREIFATGYKQRQLYEYSKSPEMIVEIIDSFLKWMHSDAFSKVQSQIEHANNKLVEALYKTAQVAMEKGISFCENWDEEKDIYRVLKQYNVLKQALVQRCKLRQDMVAKLNRILTGKVKLEINRLLLPNDYDYYTGLGERDFPAKVQKVSNKYYDYRVKISEMMKKIVYIWGKSLHEFDFFAMLLEKKSSTIMDQYKFSNLDPQDFDIIRNLIGPDELRTSFVDSVQLSYNINMGSSKLENFRSGEQLSWGQKAVALLLLILDASLEVSDSRPLLMDQPEDDLDNSYIYNTLVKEFRNSKTMRQIIISTHNANLPVISDAENIIVLRYNGESGYVDDNGSIDKPTIADSVLETLEGGKQAIIKREEKYRSFI